jgi:predicted MFS family arabinose efflux permease
MRVIGRLVDVHGAFRVGSAGAVLLAAIVAVWFVSPPPGLPVIAVFTGFMVAMALRNVSHNTLTSKVPAADERARFMSIQSAVQHLASATGAVVAAQLLSELPDHRLVGVPRIALVSIVLTLLVPPLFWLVESRVRARG